MVRSRGFQVALATGLILGAIATAVVEESTPTYRSDVLAESGNFFALAESGETLFAASGNGGSILLEQSSDHGLDWSQNPVPYSAVAGGSPWDLAAIAVDGPNLLLTAATGGVTSPPYPGGDQPGGFGAPISPGPCGTNSTILIALSPDDGISWNTSTYTLGWAAATSLQTEING
ncbi:MAG TPA: hypothetical protein VMH90_01840, partial [Thermoplasmata archaeon]|nr:hypothetical protein [Thermoplasmata archaeon]